MEETPQSSVAEEVIAEEAGEDVFPVDVECAKPWWAAPGPRLIVGAILGALAGTEIYKATIGTLPIPMVWLIAPAAVGAALLFFVPSPAYVRRATIEAGGLSITTSKKRRIELSEGEVMFVSCVGGLSLQGGELIVPKDVRLMTTSGMFTLRLGPEAAPVAFELLSQVCTQAVLVPYTGEPVIPEAVGSDRGQWLEDVRTMVRQEFGQMVRRSWIGALVALVLAGAAGAGAGLAFASGGSGSRSGPKLAIAAVVALVASGVLAGHAIKLRARQRRLLASIT